MKFLIVLLFCVQFHLGMRQDIPYRDESTYKLSLNMEFKVEKSPNSNKIEFENRNNYSPEPQLFLNASLELLKLLDDDYKIKVVNNEGTGLISKKLKVPDTYLIKLGFANHIKSQKSPNIFTIHFINKEKQVNSKIIVEIKEDGDFMVNGKRFGKI